MFKPVLAVTQVLNQSVKVKKGVGEMTSKQLLVGIPSSTSGRPGDPMNNATLGYIHEHGSPAANIPARPWLRPGVAEAKKEIETRLHAMGEAVFRGETNLDKHLTALGLVVVNAIRRRMQQGIPPPLADSTIRRRKQRSAGSKYKRKASSAKDTTPLIDTGKMIAAITFVIRKVKPKP